MELPSVNATKVYHFPAEELAAHPCSAAGRTRRRRLWIPAQAAMVLASVGVCVAICLRISDNFGLPTAVLLAAMALNYRNIQSEIWRLRDQGVLRELCLAGQPPILTLLAIQRGASAIWMAPVQAFCIVTVMILGLVTKNPLGPAMLIAVLAGSTVLTFLFWKMARRAPTTISRAEIVRTIGHARLFRLAGCCTFLLMIGYPFFRPLGGAIFNLVVAIVGVLILFFIPHEERRLLAVPDAEFEAWVEEWCVGLTPGASSS